MANSNVYTLGLSKIEIGAVGTDGGMGTVLAQLGYTYQDTCTMTMDDPETTDFIAEEVDDPVVSISRAGKINFNFSIMNADVNVLQKLLGGTITGDPSEGEPEVWNAPASIPAIEQSIKITPNQGLQFSIPRAKVTAKINGSFSKTNIFLIEVACTVLIPTKAGESKLKATKVV
ncbi:MAG: hypothetical protein LBC68_08115 [Prevotellaceae bacterium]|jgi:hypothetical protein|nr:hypothetical protein [Prevotellaceae bacterium]